MHVMHSRVFVELLALLILFRPPPETRSRLYSPRVVDGCLYVAKERFTTIRRRTKKDYCPLQISLPRCSRPATCRTRHGERRHRKLHQEWRLQRLLQQYQTTWRLLLEGFSKELLYACPIWILADWEILVKIPVNIYTPNRVRINCQKAMKKVVSIEKIVENARNRREKLKSLRQKGWKVREIAEKYGISKQRVSQMLLKP